MCIFLACDTKSAVVFSCDMRRDSFDFVALLLLLLAWTWTQVSKGFLARIMGCFF